MEVALSGRTQDGGRMQLLQGHGAEVGNLSLFPSSIPTHYHAQEVRGLDSLAESLVIQSISISGHKTRQTRADHASVQNASKEQPTEKTALTEIGTANFH